MTQNNNTSNDEENRRQTTSQASSLNQNIERTHHRKTQDHREPEKRILRNQHVSILIHFL